MPVPYYKELMVRARVVVGFSLVALLVIVLFFAPNWVLAPGLSLISALAVQELLGATKYIRKKRLIAYSVAIAAAVPIWYYLREPEWSAEVMAAAMLLIMILLFAEGMLDPENMGFEMISVVFVVSLVIPMFFSALIRIVKLPLGSHIIVVPFICAFGSDTSAFHFGKVFGKHKLAPLISPKKTVEGAIGGILGTMAMIILYGLVMQLGFNMNVNYLFLSLYGLIGSAAAQLGDLSMSFVKREFGLKDFGALLPGHGGIMDRFDSLLFAAPAAELFLLFLPALSVRI